MKHIILGWLILSQLILWIGIIYQIRKDKNELKKSDQER